MEGDLILMNLGFLAMLLAMYAATQIRLRSLLIFYQAVTIWRAYVYIDNMNMLVWHALFLVLNTYRLYQLYLESREVQVPEALEDIKQFVFSTMTPAEFLKFWDLGREVSYGVGEALVKEGEGNDRLILVLEGVADVKIENMATIAQSKRGDFVGEMSLITHNPASATVLPTEPVVCREWTRAAIEALNTQQDPVYQKLHGEIGRDIVDKLRAANEKMANNVSVLSKGIVMSQRKFEAISGEVWDRSSEVLGALKERSQDVSGTLETLKEKGQGVINKDRFSALTSRVKNPFKKRDDA